MAKTKKPEAKIILERKYIVPLRSGWLKVPKYKRANKAIKTLKEFMVQHMKVYDRDLRNIKIDNHLNNEIRYRGMKKPPAKIEVHAKKYDNGIVVVELVNVPNHVKFAKLREAKIKDNVKKKVDDKKKPEIEEKKEETLDVKEKEESAMEETMKIAKEQAKTQKHTVKDKKVQVHRKALSR